MVTCGLLTSSNKPVPLRRVAVDVCIQSFVADVSSELLYKNEESDPVEAIFTFPMDADSAVYAFQARIQDTIIKAQIQDKKEVTSRKEGPRAGGEAGMQGGRNSGGDVFTCSLGNLPPGEEAVLSLRYVQELPLEADGATRFVLPAVLHPRYAPQGWEEENVTAGVPYVSKGELPYTLSLSVSLQSPHGIARVHSNCTLTPLNYTAQDQTAAQVREDGPCTQNTASSPTLTRVDWMGSGVEQLVSGFFPHVFIQKEFGVGFRAFLCTYEVGGWAGVSSSESLCALPQIFVFTDGEVGNTQEVIAEVQRHHRSHRCFSFGIGQGASTALIKGIAEAGGGFAEFIIGQDRMAAKVLRSLKWALQPAVTGISLSWELPPGMEAVPLRPDPKVIFQGQRLLVYSQLRGQPKAPESSVGSVTLQYTIKDETFKDTVQFPLQPQEGDRLPIHRLAAKALLQELEPGVSSGSEESRHRALEASLSSGVVCSLTAYVGVDTKQGQPVQGPLRRRPIPLAAPVFSMMAPGSPLILPFCGQASTMLFSKSFSLQPDSTEMLQSDANYLLEPIPQAIGCCRIDSANQRAVNMVPESLFRSRRSCGTPQKKTMKMARCEMQTKGVLVPLPKASPLIKLVSLQNANGSWGLDSALASALGVSETDVKGKMPTPVFSMMAAPLLSPLLGAAPIMLCCSLQQDSTEMLQSDANYLLEPIPQAIEASPLIKLVSLQNANGSWGLASSLASALGVSETDVKGKMPSEGVEPGVWATVLAVVWLHSRSAAQREEWELLEIKAVGWLRSRAGSISQLDKCLEAANALLGCSVAATVFGL
ncbi:von Willebrand factor A domain-containing protein 5A-like [Alligator sinensis]|uniref:von Willebrand factor A domain-containing protein 5A-like n=2 Tax=Alligator sinensis TaxID=38654 RepID=A0A3Q0FMQ0_ALLSI|nr:von Willebrand factor A domain-containing protein 5A-like [Alligator sinensis]